MKLTYLIEKGLNELTDIKDYNEFRKEKIKASLNRDVAVII